MRLVKPDTAEMSVKLPDRSRVVRLVKLETAEMSVKLPCKSSDVRFVAFSNPVRSLRSRHVRAAESQKLLALSEVNVFISASVTAAVAARFSPRALLIALRRSASGMFTFAAETGGAPESNTTPTSRQNTISFVIKCSQMFI